MHNTTSTLNMKSAKLSKPRTAAGAAKRSHPTTAKAKAAKKVRIAAPQPTLPGTCGSIGIDIAKKTFHACYLKTCDAREQRGEFTNDAAGHARLMLWVNRVSQGQAVHFCLEETGIYGRALAVFPHQAQHQRLRELSRRRAQLTQMIVDESNHSEAAQESGVRSHIDALIQHLQQQREGLWRQMQQLVKDDAALNPDHAIEAEPSA